jgi:hypothetical protein
MLIQFFSRAPVMRLLAPEESEIFAPAGAVRLLENE